MASAIEIPFSRAVPNAEQSFLRPTAMVAARESARTWGQVAQFGAFGVVAVNEWERRRDNRALADAQAQHAAAANEFAQNYQRRQDLDERDAKGQNGYQRAEKEYTTFLDTKTRELSKTLSRRVRPEFESYAKAATVEQVQRLKFNLIDHEKAYNRAKALEDADTIVATGDDDAIKSWTEAQLDYFSPEDQTKFLDTVKAKRVQDLIRRGLSNDAITLLESHRDMFTSRDVWDSLHKEAATAGRIADIEATRRLEDLKDKTQTELMLGILQDKFVDADTGNVDLRPLYEAADSGLIDAGTLYQYHRILTTPPKTETDGLAFWNVSKAIGDAKARRLSRSQAFKIFLENAADISREDRKQFMSAISGLDDPARPESSKQAEAFYEMQLNQLYRYEAQDDDIGIQEALRRHQRRQFDSWEFFREHPDATPEEVKKYHDQFFNSAQAQQKTRSWFWRVLNWYGRRRGGPRLHRVDTTPSAASDTSRTARSLPDKAPTGLEDVWDTMDDETKSKVMYLLDQKVPVDIIRESLD